MREKGLTSIHLLLATIVTTFGIILILAILAFSWEPWMVFVILIGNTLVWCLHIGRIGSETFYENLCAGLLMVGFFFFGVHKITLFDVPAVACMMVLVFSMFNKKRLLYMTAALYMLVLLYHFLFLGTITLDMDAQEMIRLAVGITVVTGSIAISRFRIIRRLESRKQYDTMLSQLEKSGQQNAEFLSNVSHELRTPINMVLGISEVILEKDISPEIRANMESIKLAGKRLSNQINNMLDYTEIMEGTLTPAREPYRIVSVLNDLITMTAMQSSKHQLEMVFDLAPKIPAVLVGDVEKISHILKILVENSIKFTEEGGINVCIQFRRESYGVNLIIDIYDTGIGMTEDQLTQICDDFYQADSGSSRIAGGLGLGLPIARGLLHAMGGFIHFDSKEQQGLQVHITIPQGVEKDTPAMVISNPKPVCVACYFRPEKYNCDDVRRYYDNMILHMVEGLNIEGYQAHNFDGLLKILNTHPVTHVFIAQAEYEENSSYYEKLSDTTPVVVIADQNFVVNHSGIMVIRKPFFALSVVNLLNGEIRENGFGEAQAAGRKPFSCDGVQVLAVDDEEMNLVVAKGVLGSYGIQVDTCLSGREAVERCSSPDCHYDIIFLDHMMPGFDGVETLKQIRTLKNGEYKELPIIALTANTISGAREMFRSEGFTEFIPKPIERSVLEKVLRKVLPQNHVQYEEMSAASDEDSLFHETFPAGGDGSTYKAAPARSESSARETSPAGGESLARETFPNGGESSAREAFPDGSESLAREAFPDGGESPARETSPDDGGFPAHEASSDHGASSNYEVTHLFSSPGGSGKADGQVFEVNIPKATAPDYDLPEHTDLNNTVSRREKTQQHIFEFDIPRPAAPDYDREYDTTPQTPEPAESSRSFAPLAQVGINIQLGLDYCCGEDEFYMEMLDMFCSQAEKKKNEIISLYDAADWPEYTVKVHALKSTSMTIGAEQLAEQARLLEQAGKSNDIDYIRFHHSALLSRYDEICRAIAEL